ncbi:MAG: ATP-binding protein, partial [Phycisphaerales bacterium]
SQSNQQLQEFTYVASHDLREPTRKISSFGQLLVESLADKLEDDDKENLNFMIEGADRMQQMIEALLTYSRVSTKGVTFERVDLNEIIEQLKSLELSAKLEETNGTISAPEPLPAIDCDPAQIRQLLQNLISNGLKYQRNDVVPEITVRAKAEDNGIIRIEIQDNGIGIKEEQFDNVFVMFRRLHSKQEYEGTGIGLAVCKRIVERHGGEIGVNSTYGEGSTFWFTIPVSQISVENEEATSCSSEPINLINLGV